MTLFHPGPRPVPREANAGYLVTTTKEAARAEAPPPLRNVVPVFDRGRHNPVPRPLPESFECRRMPSDARPGTPLPPEATGDPRPDRLEHAERIRQAILAKDARYRIEGSVDREETAPKPRGPKSRTPDIEKPRSYYVDIPAASAAVEARRGEQVLYFMTVTEAARCLTGERKDGWDKAIRNAMGGVTKGAFGWTWTRLKSRQGRRWSR